jgi:predicted CoA-binding protein
MNSGRRLIEDHEIKDVLCRAKTIAVLGLSAKPEKDSYQVAQYLKEQGYRIIPVSPGKTEILEEKAYASLDDIRESVDIVDVFRNPGQIVPHAHEAIRLHPGAFWMQLGIENDEAAALLVDAGIDVVMNLCIKVEHGRLCK